MRRRGFLQAIFGAAAIPAAIKAADALAEMPELPVAKPAPSPIPLRTLDSPGAYTTFCSAGAPVKITLWHEMDENGFWVEHVSTEDLGGYTWR